MKTIKWITAVALGLSVLACTPKSAPADGMDPAAKSAKDYLPSKATVDSVSYLLGINFGSFLKGYNFGKDLNYAQIEKGMKDFVNAKGNMRDADFAKQFKINPEKMNELFNAYLENMRAYTATVNKEKGEKYCAANAKRPGVITTESGLQYKVIDAGNDVKPSLLDTVWVNYKGTTIDGEVFDETPEGAEPVRFTLNRVVKGWQEGLTYIGEGGKIELAIPADLAYGEQGNQGIEPNSTLLFEIELTKVGKVQPAEAE